ncbi:MAG: hypothetical protein R2941_05690 [Desulfobacterales bacterium]
MTKFFRKFFAPADLGKISLKPYSVNFSLERLRTGIDNIRHDVRLSETFCKALRNIVFQVIIRRLRAEEILAAEENLDITQARDEFSRLCREIVLEAINRAKLENEVQIDTLAQTAIIKMLQEEVKSRYEEVADRFKNVIRKYGMANKTEQAIAAKKKLSEMEKGHNREEILADIGKELFCCFADAQNPDANEMRRINFGDSAVVPDDFLANPMFCVGNFSDDYFMLREYHILLGHRLDDPDKYDILLPFIQNLIGEIICRNSGEQGEAADACPPELISGWLKRKENVDILFNCFQSGYQYRMLTKKGGVKQENAEQLKMQTEVQKKCLNYLYRKLQKAGLIRRIIVSYEIQPVYSYYCPPLVPQLIVQYFLSFRMRRTVISRLRRLNRFYGSSFSIAPLRKIRWKLRFIAGSGKKGYLIRFLKDLSRYHRDRQNCLMVRQSADSVNLLAEEKMCNLSRANNSLYEFLLPHERVSEEKPLINHVIIKADVRGSTDITHRMMMRNLNPASYFSLNFFDPITEILPEYGAEKVFVEGDAIILSLFERKDMPEGWYSVARACGLADRILSIVRQCNFRNQKNTLPIIELGIGISYRNTSPAFLFDGAHRIMISSAINLADRLSGCSKMVRRQMLNRKTPFNLYVFQTVSDEDMNSTSDDLYQRYNVNGIELNAAGFEKLKTEIDLKPVQVGIRALDKNRVRFYTGRFPTVTGSYQRLVIRESRIPRVDPNTFAILSLTRKKYYEICTNRKLFEHIENLIKEI